ncbi:MAG: SDR family NAD(P)-dependent oxidoreductase [Candidatus Omnitrophica bacterium]|nr:SDR family NAD(P)-dependent oxidoreductase [Candidatus Omnitrophota bacterium]
MKIFIITGVSKGLGNALARELSGKDSFLFLIARRDVKSLIKKIKGSGGDARGLICDLARLKQLERLMDRVFLKIKFKKISSITLINNAGIINPIAFAGSFLTKSAIMNLNVNCIAPLILSHLFIKKMRKFKAKKIIVNISSGAARKPFEGWSLYCSAKSAVEMFTKVVTNEQARYKNGVRIFSVDPGAIDTNMQFQIRNKSRKDFPCVKKFIDLKKTKALKTPEAVAGEIHAFINDKLK